MKRNVITLSLCPFTLRVNIESFGNLDLRLIWRTHYLTFLASKENKRNLKCKQKIFISNQ